VRDAATGFGRLVTHAPAVRTGIATGSDFEVWKAAFDVQALVYLAIFLVLIVVVWQRFGTAYGVYSTLSIASR
jgi:hypothetical protein